MRIKLSADSVRSEWVERIHAESGQDVMACYHCGKCSAGCPAAGAMDLLPNQIIRMIQLGQRERALTSQTIWYCAACQTCYARCPKGVDLPRLMEVLRELAMQEYGDHLEIASFDPQEIAEFPQQAFIAGFRKFTK